MGWTPPKRHRCARVEGSSTPTAGEIHVRSQHNRIGFDEDRISGARRQRQRSDAGSQEAAARPNASVLFQPASLRGAMEACVSADYWGREITKVGHEVKLIAPA